MIKAKDKWDYLYIMGSSTECLRVKKICFHKWIKENKLPNKLNEQVCGSLEDVPLYLSIEAVEMS